MNESSAGSPAGKPSATLVPAPRIASIDAYRGLAILLMAAANYLAGIGWIPPFLKHARDVGFTVIDEVAPMFVFAMALGYGPSFRRRAGRDGSRAAYGAFARRYLALIGIGAILAAGESLALPEEGVKNWGALCALGSAGLLALFLIKTHPYVRLAIAASLLVAYQILLDRFFLAATLASSHGGIFGSLGWTAMFVTCTATADLADSYPTAGKRAAFWAVVGAAGALAAFVVSLVAPISKNRVSPAYVYLGFGLAAAAYALVVLSCDGRRPRFGFLRTYGRNALALYLLHELLLGFYALPDAPPWYAEAAAWLMALQLAVLLGLLYLASRLMEKRGITLKL
jgi:predicted acyltransferase